MKKVTFFCFLLLVFSGCRVKKLDVEKSKIRTETSYLKRLDSLFLQTTQQLEELTKSQRLQALKFDLESIKDSNGNVRDFEITHERNGQIVEKIQVKGAFVKGSFSDEIQTSESEKKAQTQEVAKIETDISETTISETISKSKSKKIRAVGFQWGIYTMLIGALLLGFGVYKLRSK